MRTPLLFSGSERVRIGKQQDRSLWPKAEEEGFQVSCRLNRYKNVVRLAGREKFVGE